MSFLTTLGHLLVPQREDYRELQSDFDLLPLDEQIARLRRQAPTRSYRLPSVEEAMGVPAIHGAVTLIANTVGSLSLETFQNGSVLTDPLRIPRITMRPNPLTKPYDFWRDTAWYLATRGEFWWWIAARDSDNLPLALFCVPPWEIRVESNQRNRLRPTIFWGDAKIPNEDIIGHRYLPDDVHPYRGKGPLQRSNAAISVAVEADAWAGNFFSGSLPSVIGTTDEDLGDTDLQLLDKQWLEKDNNLPRWMTNGVKLGEPPYNAEKAQLTQTRQNQVGEVARMFNMPGSLLEYNMPGASLRYQNDEQIWTDFQRRCLSPSYLEPIEQAMSDLLVRSMSARFNLDQLLRADSKTRAEIYNLTVPLGIDTVEEARQREGKVPGNINFAPVPGASPAAAITRLPDNSPASLSRELAWVYCPKGHKAGRSDGNTEIKCKCGQMAVQLIDRPEQPTVQPAPQVNVTPQITLTSPDFTPIDEAALKTERLTEAVTSILPYLEQIATRELPAPVVNLAAAEAPQVTVQTGSFVDAINDLKAMMSAPRTRKVLRDENDQIIGSIEEIA